MTIQPLILCGGAGTRLWPESRGVRAKQFLALAGADTLFQQTLQRPPTGEGFAPPLILCGAAHVETVCAQLGEQHAELIVEPDARGTAAAIALAVAAIDVDTLLLVMPSDHVIADLDAFHAAIVKGAALARQDWLVTFGITPERPDTGFGYIASGTPLGDGGYRVERFFEKPPLADAEAMVAHGGFSWNAGIFLFRAGRMRGAMLEHCRAIFEAAEDALAATASQRLSPSWLAALADSAIRAATNASAASPWTRSTSAASWKAFGSSDITRASKRRRDSQGKALLRPSAEARSEKMKVEKMSRTSRRSPAWIASRFLACPVANCIANAAAAPSTPCTT